MFMSVLGVKGFPVSNLDGVTDISKALEEKICKKKFKNAVATTICILNDVICMMVWISCDDVTSVVEAASLSDQPM